MRLLSFRIDDRSSYGALVEGRIVDLGRHLPEHRSLKALLEAEALVRALDTAAEVSAEFRDDQVDFLPPVPNAEKVLCIFDAREADVVLIDPAICTGHGQPLFMEGVIEGAVEGAEGSPATLAAGVAYVLGKDAETIAGLTLMTFIAPNSAAIGPWLVTTEEIEDTIDLTVSVTCGDADKSITVPDPVGLLNIAAEHSLSTGDVIAMLYRLPDICPEPGNTVEVAADKIGTLKCLLERAEV